MIKFKSYGDEWKKIKSGEIKEISREIDYWNPVFKELEEIQGAYASKDPIYGRSTLGTVSIDGEDDYEVFKIKEIGYKDGFVIIKW